MRPNRHRSRHRMRKSGKRETRLLMRFVPSSPASRRTSSVRPSTEPWNNLRPAVATPLILVNYPTDPMRNTGLYLRKMEWQYHLLCSSIIKLIERWQESFCSNFQIASATLRIHQLSSITILSSLSRSRHSSQNQPKLNIPTVWFHLHSSQDSWRTDWISHFLSWLASANIYTITSMP